MAKREFGSLQEELTFRQRKLIPLNIAIAIVSLIAAIATAFLPLLKLDIGQVMAMMQEQGGSESTEETGSSVLQQKIMTSMGSEAFSFTLIDFAKTGLSENPIEALMGSMYGAGGMIENMGIASVSIAVIDIFPGISMDTISVEQAKAVSLSDLNAAVKMIPSDKDRAKAAMVAAAEREAAKLEIAADDAFRTEVETFFDEIYLLGCVDPDAAEPSGYTTERMVCRMMSESECETYAELKTYMEESSESGSGSGSPTEGMEEAAPMIKMMFLVLFGINALAVLTWAVLFLFSFFRIFARNKRFTMWYAKIFGGVPCLLLWVAPKIATLVAGGMEGGTEIIAMLGAIGTTAWIGGICYLAMWIFSIFWAFPIKRKIRRLIKEQKYAADLPAV